MICTNLHPYYIAMPSQESQYTEACSTNIAINLAYDLVWYRTKKNATLSCLWWIWRGAWRLAGAGRNHREGKWGKEGKPWLLGEAGDGGLPWLAPPLEQRPKENAPQLDTKKNNFYHRPMDSIVWVFHHRGQGRVVDGRSESEGGRR